GDVADGGGDPDRLTGRVTAQLGPPVFCVVAVVVLPGAVVAVCALAPLSAGPWVAPGVCVALSAVLGAVAAVRVPPVAAPGAVAAVRAARAAVAPVRVPLAVADVSAAAARAAVSAAPGFVAAVSVPGPGGGGTNADGASARCSRTGRDRPAGGLRVARSGPGTIGVTGGTPGASGPVILPRRGGSLRGRLPTGGGQMMTGPVPASIRPRRGSGRTGRAAWTVTGAGATTTTAAVTGCPVAIRPTGLRGGWRRTACTGPGAGGTNTVPVPGSIPVVIRPGILRGGWRRGACANAPRTGVTAATVTGGRTAPSVPRGRRPSCRGVARTGGGTVTRGGCPAVMLPRRRRTGDRG